MHFTFLLHSNLYKVFLSLQEIKNAGDGIASLNKEHAALHQMKDTWSVDSILMLLHQHLVHSAGIFNPGTALAALAQLVDIARDKLDQRASRFTAILCQTQLLLLQPVIIIQAGTRQRGGSHS